MIPSDATATGITCLALHPGHLLSSFAGGANHDVVIYFK
jgi:hypothetical protein